MIQVCFCPVLSLLLLNDQILLFMIQRTGESLISIWLQLLILCLNWLLWLQIAVGWLQIPDSWKSLYWLLIENTHMDMWWKLLFQQGSVHLVETCHKLCHHLPESQVDSLQLWNIFVTCKLSKLSKFYLHKQTSM